jgi:hypothetical protein
MRARRNARSPGLPNLLGLLNRSLRTKSFSG